MIVQGKQRWPAAVFTKILILRISFILRNFLVIVVYLKCNSKKISKNF